MRRLTPRDVANVALHRLTLLWLRLRLSLQRNLRLTTSYQPDPFSPIRRSSEARDSQERFEAFAKLLPEGEPLSTLDIGCNEGFFVFRMAEQGGTCLGFDLDRNAIMVAEARAWLHGSTNALFAVRSIDRHSAQSLPDVDVVICLSVFHHWVRHMGVEEAIATLSAVAAHAKHYLVFETGQPNELRTRWADQLAFMGEDYRTWVNETLITLGFQEVRQVGEFRTTVSPTLRSLFVAAREA